MGSERFDVLVVGAGPAGSVAATVLARAGSRVLLIDKEEFPRDKVCGDLVGQRGVKLLADLGLPLRRHLEVARTDVVTSSGRVVPLDLPRGDGYAEFAMIVRRLELDHQLLEAAVNAGVEHRVAGFQGPVHESHRDRRSWRLSTGETIRADFIVGADGATTRVGDTCGLVDPSNTLWGFAVRTYVGAQIETATIMQWDARPHRGFPGFGWAFPTGDGGANIGLGVGVLGQRSQAAAATKSFRSFLADFVGLGVLEPAALQTDASVAGAWLKMGMVGTVPARGRVLLVGEAAGLTNPLQGEGISQAMISGAAAARAIIDNGAQAAPDYRRFLHREFVPYDRVAVHLQTLLVRHPRLVSVGGVLLSREPMRRLFRGGWSIYWNDLLTGARRGWSKAVATLVHRIGHIATLRSPTSRWFDTLGPDTHCRWPLARWYRAASSLPRGTHHSVGSAPLGPRLATASRRYRRCDQQPP